MILGYLDELSLVRIQGASKYFRRIITNERSLKARLGLRDASQTVVNTTQPERPEGLTWNPLLDWVSTRLFLHTQREARPVNVHHDRLIFHFLPLALRAAKAPFDSSPELLHHNSAHQPHHNAATNYEGIEAQVAYKR